MTTTLTIRVLQVPTILLMVFMGLFTGSAYGQDTYA